jgi:nucleoside-diphosphate-sugar epimerase
MTVLLTGSSGFIGSELFKKIKTTTMPIKVMRSQFFLSKLHNLKEKKNFVLNNVNQNIKYSKLFSGISTIIHCAAIKSDASKNYKDFKKINVEYTTALAKQAVFYNVKRFIYLSSISVNEKENLNSTFLKYNHTPKPKNFYAISKLEAEKALLEISKQTGLEVVIIRPPLVYGKKVGGNFLSLLNLVYKQIPLPILNIKFPRSLIGIDNLIDVIISCINHPNLSGKILLVSDGEDISLVDLVKKLSKIMKKPLKLFSVPSWLLWLIFRLTFGKDSYIKLFRADKIDISYTRKVLQWSPRFTIDQQLKKTINWYLKNR